LKHSQAKPLRRASHANTPCISEMGGWAGLAHIANVCIGGRPTVACSHVHICWEVQSRAAAVMPISSSRPDARFLARRSEDSHWTSTADGDNGIFYRSNHI
jgi:hypothetical protein